jgi:hypothetical protein
MKPPTPRPRLWPFAAAFLVCALSLAGAAQAQTSGAGAPGAPDRDLAAAVVPAKAGPGGLKAALRRAYAPPEGTGANQAVAARTEIDRRFGAEGVSGSLGYLCGIDSYPHDFPQARGPASSYGRESTFLGAKLSYAFK